MVSFDCELVGKIGSMALIRKKDNDIDYNIFSRLGAELRPGFIWVSSGATEIGRLDYMKRNLGMEIEGTEDEIKTDYAAQGQAILMENYRRFIDPRYSVRQVLVEHQHFNTDLKRDHIRRLLMRAIEYNAIPIVNYNDPVDVEENRKMELSTLKQIKGEQVVECVDNDETASVIAELVKTRILLILTSTDGIYKDHMRPETLMNEISGSNTSEVIENIRIAQQYCIGTSRAGSNGAYAKLEYILGPVKNGTQVIIGNARYRISELLAGSAPRTWIGVR